LPAVKRVSCKERRLFVTVDTLLIEPPRRFVLYRGARVLSITICKQVRIKGTSSYYGHTQAMLSAANNIERHRRD
jgi:hypothetical protein